MTTTQIPTSPAELEELLSNKEKVQASIANGTFSEVVKNYARTFAAKNQDFQAEVREQTQLAMAEFLKDSGAKLVNRIDMAPEDKSAPKYSPIRNPRALGAKIDGMFASSADYFQAMWHKNDKEEVLGQKRSIRAIMQEKVPGDGGFLVPEEFRSEILRLSLGSAIVRPRARVIPMGSARLSIPAVDATSNVSSVYGGIVAYWTEEAAQLQQSQPSFSRIALDAKKLTAFTYASNELIADWGAFSVFLNEIFPEAIAWYEDLAFLSGTGVGEPLGALNSGNTALISVTKETNQVAATIVWENVIKMYARMLPSSLNRAVWIASPDTFVELATMALVVGTGGSAVWLTDGTGAPVLTLLGRPVIMSEKAPAVLGTVGDLSFVDFGMYLIGDRQTMTVDSSEHVRFDYDETAFRVIERVDGRPWVQSAITPKNNSSTLSPFVQLATRS